MENSENKILDENSFVNNDESLTIGSKEINDYLLETSKWGKFLAIVGFVGMGLFMLLAIFIIGGFSQLNGTYGGGLPTSFGYIYLFLGLIYFLPINYLYQFSVKIKQGLQSNDLPTAASGFENLKSLFKFMGIFTIIILSMYGLILLIAIPMFVFFNH
ncbi:MAG TPA: hypothetical protein VL443_14300 [Cyclobacteriaceae bacterium]|jgi:hypothetical protein|nr:hypothetical protein [Cyclobacteriaceae bacterium]